MSNSLGTLGQWIGGSFLGAVLTLSVGWYLTRPTSVTYNLTTTTLGADPTVKSIIPDLKIQIGNKEVAALHTHALQVSTVSGRYVEKADLAIQWNTPVTFYGAISVEAPSLSHKITCEQHERGATCSLSPMVIGHGSYRIAMATDQSQLPLVQLVGKDVTFSTAEEATRRQERWINIIVGGTPLVLSAIGMIFGYRQNRRSKRNERIRQRKAQEDL
jgi:hypothetical protein